MATEHMYRFYSSKEYTELEPNAQEKFEKSMREKLRTKRRSLTNFILAEVNKNVPAEARTNVVALKEHLDVKGNFKKTCNSEVQKKIMEFLEYYRDNHTVNDLSPASMFKGNNVQEQIDSQKMAIICQKYIRLHKDEFEGFFDVEPNEEVEEPKVVAKTKVKPNKKVEVVEDIEVEKVEEEVINLDKKPKKTKVKAKSTAKKTATIE